MEEGGDAQLTPDGQLMCDYIPVLCVSFCFNRAITPLVMLGSGWYRGFIGFGGQKDFYGVDSLYFSQIT
jgi:hypothetical protein